MTQVFFYHNAASRIVAAAALLGKACRQGKAVLVYAPDETLAEALDRQLWVAPPTGFIPHVFAESPLAAETPIVITADTAVTDAKQWLREQDTCTVTLWNGVPLTVVPPMFVELKIVETDPGVRGDTATGGMKPARLETGAVVKVPLFINEGEVIKVDTRSSEYASRVK